MKLLLVWDRRWAKPIAVIRQRGVGGLSRARLYWDRDQRSDLSGSCWRIGATWCTVHRYIGTRAPIDPGAVIQPSPEGRLNGSWPADGRRQRTISSCWSPQHTDGSSCHLLQNKQWVGDIRGGAIVDKQKLETHHRGKWAGRAARPWAPVVKAFPWANRSNRESIPTAGESVFLFWLSDRRYCCRPNCATLEQHYSSFPCQRQTTSNQQSDTPEGHPLLRPGCKSAERAAVCNLKRDTYTGSFQVLETPVDR